MNTIKTGGPAYPRPFFENADGEWSPPQEGMSLRDWFAGQAMSQGMSVLVASQHNLNEYQIGQLAKTAYLAADAMLKAREAQS